MIVQKENWTIRLCINITKLNSGAQQELYQLESIDKTLAKLGKDCNIMSNLDANAGYWQIPLDEESQFKATFITPFRQILPNTRIFWFCINARDFQQIFRWNLHWNGTGSKSTDDFLVHGKDVEEHDQRMYAFLTRLAEHSVTFNLSKCQFHQTKIDFLDHPMTAKRIQPLTSKLGGITNYKAPQSITECYVMLCYVMYSLFKVDS